MVASVRDPAAQLVDNDGVRVGTLHTFTRPEVVTDDHRGYGDHPRRHVGCRAGEEQQRERVCEDAAECRECEDAPQVMRDTLTPTTPILSPRSRGDAYTLSRGMRRRCESTRSETRSWLTPFTTATARFVASLIGLPLNVVPTTVEPA